MRQANERALPMAPTVSIVTPTYNRAHLLPRAWASIARQTETRLEWIVVDDGSTDNTRQVVLAFNDPRIHYIYQHNQGENEACLSGYHPHPLYVVCLLGLQARAGAGALRRRSG